MPQSDSSSTSSSSSSLSYFDACCSYGLDTAACHAATNSSSAQSKKCRSLPNCLHGLKAKRGIWEATPSALKALGADPGCRRRAAGQLVGLTNLAATCYLSTQLQCLFMNSHFRHTLYLFRSAHEHSAAPASASSSSSAAAAALSLSSPSPSLSSPSSSSPSLSGDDSVVLILQQLFGLMEYGPLSSANPEPLVRELGLNRYQQQDINEFTTLFLSHLDSRLRTCAELQQAEETQRVRSLIGSEFMGETVDAVRCLVCGSGSERVSSFLDCSLQVRGKKTLQDCLRAMTGEERLQHANRYFCSLCQQKRDAVKHTAFKSLPPVLNLQLIRFHFDVETGQKKKLNDRIFIPYRLDMADYMQHQQQQHQQEQQQLSADTEYQLTAVLRHKGVSAHRGHYTCELRDARGQWWIFDDEKVGLGGDQFNAKGDAAVARVAQAAAAEEKTDDKAEAADKKKKKRKKRLTLTMKKKKQEVEEGQGRMTDYLTRPAADSEQDVVVMDDSDAAAADGTDDGDVVEERREQRAGQVQKVDGDYSSNAYMLVYTRISRLQADRAAAAEAAEKRAANEQQAGDGAAGKATSKTASPSFICDCHSSCRPPPMVKQAIEQSVRKLESDELQYEQRRAQLMLKVEERKREVEEVLEELDTAGPVTKHWAQSHERRRRDGQRRPQEREEGEKEPQQQQRRRSSVVVDVEAELEDAETEDEDFFFVHVGWLQRWLNGQTEKEWSDEQAERVGDARGRPAGGAATVKAGGNKQTDAIVLDEDDDVAPDDGAQTSLPAAESPVVRIDVTEEETIEDDAALLPLSSPSSSPPAGTASFSSPSSSSSSSPSLSVLLDDANPLWPGSLYASNSKLCCPHGLLDPRPHCLVRVKRISARAWQHLLAANVSTSEQRRAFLASAGMEPATAVVLDADSLCQQCVRELRDVQRELESQRSQYEALLDGMKEFTSTSGRSPGAWRDGEWARSGFLLHKDWFRELSNSLRLMRQKAFCSTPFRPDSSENINAGLSCPHGRLVLSREEQAYLISPAMWSAFLSLYPKSAVFPASSRDCEDCAQEQKEEMRERRKLAEKLQREQSAVIGLKKFLRGSNHLSFPDSKRCLLPGQRFYLLPAGWVQHEFIPYQQQAEVDNSLPVLVQPSPAPIADLLCSQHRRLRYNPVPLSSTQQQQDERSTAPALPGVKPGVLTYCDASVWRALVELGYVAEEDSQGVWLQARSVMDASHFGVEEWSSIVLECSPPLCLDCIRDSQQRETDRLRLFEHGSLRVKRIASSVPIASAAAATAASASPQPAASSSSPSPAPGSVSPVSTTRGRRKRSVPAVESFTAHGLHHLDDVGTVKMKLSQYCAHSPAAMRLWYAETELREGKRLVDYAVENGGELLMKVEAELWEADFMDFMPSDDVVHNADVESGFAGTKLTTAGTGDERRHSPQPAAPSSAIARPARQEAAAEDSGASGPPPGQSLSKSEAKPEPGSGQSRPGAENGALSPLVSAAPIPTLPRISSPPVLPALDASKAARPAPSRTASPALSQPTTMVSSAFLASLRRQGDRPQQQLQARWPQAAQDSATTGDEALARQLSQQEERKRPTVLQSAEQQQQQDQYARLVHEEEQQAMLRRQAERERQEKAGLAAAQELSRQLRREQQQAATWVERKEGNALYDDDDGDVDDATDDADGEDEDDDDDDYDDREEKQMRKKTTDRKPGRGRAGDRGGRGRGGGGEPASNRPRAVRGRPSLGSSQSRGRASRAGRKMRDVADSADEQEQEEHSDEEQGDDEEEEAPPAPPAAARGRDTRQKALQSAAEASQATPFSCNTCTFLNVQGGDRCGMCATQRGATAASG